MIENDDEDNDPIEEDDSNEAQTEQAENEFDEYAENDEPTLDDEGKNTKILKLQYSSFSNLHYVEQNLHDSCLAIDMVTLPLMALPWATWYPVNNGPH